MATKKRGRGRPKVYGGNKGKHIMSLLKQFKNHSHVMEILNADQNAKAADYDVPDGGTKADCQAAAAGERALAAKRSATLFPEPAGISMPTLAGLAKAAGVKVKRGRPRAA